MKKVVSFRLGQPARERLVEMATGRGVSQSRVVEDLILAREPAVIVAGDPPEVIVRSPTPPVQDVSATKKVIERPAKAGRPEQGKTTLTGKPFGAVPKK